MAPHRVPFLLCAAAAAAAVVSPLRSSSAFVVVVPTERTVGGVVQVPSLRRGGGPKNRRPRPCRALSSAVEGVRAEAEAEAEDVAAAVATNDIVVVVPENRGKRRRHKRQQGGEGDGSGTWTSTPTSTTTNDPPPARPVDNNPGPGPGAAENVKFECHPTVAFWRDFQGDGFWSVRENAAEIVRIGTEFAALGPNGMRFWMRHVARSGYFAANAALGTAAFRLSETLAGATLNLLPTARHRKGGDDDDGGLPIAVDSRIASRLLLEAALCYRQDYDMIRGGAYVEPWDMVADATTPAHRQSSPLIAARQTGRFVREAVGTLGRRKRGEEEDRTINIPDGDGGEAGEGGGGPAYPDYYRTAFHYQTDGWMSKRSADVYETSTETLFLGRQDAMQRISLPPVLSLAETLKRKREAGGREGGRPMRVLEVACGTGRFMTFIRDNLPSDAEYTATDLSPHYLDSARENDAYWREMTRRRQRRGRPAKFVEKARIIQANAESLPFDDASFDAVVCVYLFHELPRLARGRATAEMARIVSPGGVVVLTDSIQRGDRPILDDKITNFGNMNEPFFRDYLEDDLVGHFERVGMKCGTKMVRSTTKSLSFVKPEI